MSEIISIINFGPIRKIEMPIRKINVLIGDQGTGKSTVAKVIALFKDWSFLCVLDKNTFNHFNLLDYFNSDSEIRYANALYEVYYKDGKFSINFKNAEIERIYLSLQKEHNKLINGDAEQNFTLFNSLKNSFESKLGTYLYFPAERVVLTTTKDNIELLGSISDHSQYLRNFVLNYNIHKEKHENIFIPELDINFYYQSGKETLKTKNDKEIQIYEAATGIQSILPIVVIFEHQTKFNSTKGIYIIEEPEMNLFPEKQNALINYIVGKINSLDDGLFLTTHSPYILSSLNNLLYSYKIGKNNELAVNNIINQKYWIDTENISAFILNDQGFAEDLMDYEIGQLMAEKIDEVSQVINNKFDQLLKIEFATNE